MEVLERQQPLQLQVVQFGAVSDTAIGTISGTTNVSGISRNLRNGAVSGIVAAGGENPTDYTGGTETAPNHVYVHWVIRTKP